MPVSTVMLPAAIAIVMATVMLWLVWRVFVAGGHVRRERASAGQVAEIARLAERELGDLIVVVDEVRHRRMAPAGVQTSLAEANEALGRHTDEAAALGRNPAWAAVSAALVADMERAQRAIDLVSHGSRLLVDVAAVDAEEGETAVKRGYLNLVHAREAIRERREAILAGSAPRRRTTGTGQG